MTRSGCLVLAVTVFVSTAFAQASTTVAVVNVPLVSERYQKTADLEARFEALRIELGDRRKALQEKAERAGKSLREEFKPGTKEFAAQRKKLAMLEAEMQWFVESEGKNVEQGLAVSLREIFDDIQAAVHAIAAEKSLSIVLAADQMPDEHADSPTQARQQILLQKVLYWSPEVDITQDVIDRLNTEYRSERKKTSSAAPVSRTEMLASAGAATQ